MQMHFFHNGIFLVQYDLWDLPAKTRQTIISPVVSLPFRDVRAQFLHSYHVDLIFFAQDVVRAQSSKEKRYLHRARTHCSLPRG